MVVIGAVVIGRNEGERLRACLSSLAGASTVVYVDSGSTDGSVQLARARGIEVVELDLSIPFTAARARNAGFRRLRQIRPDVAVVQFVDGDCELDPSWCAMAAEFLSNRPDVAAVCGHLRERYPDQSVYNWMCQREWDRPTGEIRACAGNVMMRVAALAEVGGYREDVIAAEEDELCVRLRAAKWRIWRLADEMAVHDAAMLHFRQWWTRSVRAGYAFAQGAWLHGRPPERHFSWERRRTLIWGIAIPLAWLIGVALIGSFGNIVLLIYPAQFLRLTLLGTGPLSENLILAFFQLLSRFPEAVGQLRFLRDLVWRRAPTIIEHKVSV
ncbi:glycosyl transferase [Bradyrhizobium sp. CCBAU 11434]|nr:glycosyl transferase [Bradyrhizobium sp. CCBAU 11434]